MGVGTLLNTICSPSLDSI